MLIQRHGRHRRDEMNADDDWLIPLTVEAVQTALRHLQEKLEARGGMSPAALLTLSSRSDGVTVALFGASSYRSFGGSLSEALQAARDYLGRDDPAAINATLGMDPAGRVTEPGWRP
jgi:hypothetical protein